MHIQFRMATFFYNIYIIYSPQAKLTKFANVEIYWLMAYIVNENHIFAAKHFAHYMAFRVRKTNGTFEKRTPENLIDANLAVSKR